jgi:protoporphyrin/coproporphyrin ferrochelatase
MRRPGTRYGVLLMTYGSPASLDDVPRYIRAVRGGREVPPEVVDEMRRRYGVIGASPLVEITQAQAAALEAQLDGDAIVRAGMRFSPPYVLQVLAEIADAGIADVVAIVMSPQFSPLLMGGYGRAVDEARLALGSRAPAVHAAGAWHTQPEFISALAGRLAEALSALGADEGDRAPVLLTAHSLPRRVAEQEPGYLAQLEETARLVAAKAGLAAERWTFCWQSAGHEPGEWMKPDFADLMPELAAAGHRSVVVAPLQFLSDHLEVLYDLDVGAREQAEASGLRFVRTRSLNVEPRFIEALAAVARRTAAAAEMAAAGVAD